MNELIYTLVSDGSSDRALVPILNWLLIKNGIKCAIQPQWADLTRLRHPVKSLKDRLISSLVLYPCDLLFVHRDAENATREKRVDEIESAISELESNFKLPHICVIPVRMMEAWLLFDAQAIRLAAGNGSGQEKLDLPALFSLENLANPKDVLFSLLLIASGLSGRRLRRFPTRIYAYRVPDFINDFSPLRQLPAFAALENDLHSFVSKYHFYSH